jgi:hypothetical protein
MIHFDGQIPRLRQLELSSLIHESFTGESYIVATDETREKYTRLKTVISVKHHKYYVIRR